MARTREVYPTNEIAHLWAHKTQSAARNPGKNFYFEGDTIYSYGSHFPIARHVVNAKGVPAIVFTQRSYSVTTAKHINLVRRAIPASVPVFDVPTISRYGLNPTITELLETAKSDRAALDSAKSKPSRALKFRALEKSDGAYVDFCKFFGVKYRSQLPANAAELESQAAEYEATRQTRREALQAVHRERRRLEHEAWIAAEPERARAEELRRAQRELERAERAAKLPQALEGWKSGSPVGRIRFRGDISGLL